MKIFRRRKKPGVSPAQICYLYPCTQHPDPVQIMSCPVEPLFAGVIEPTPIYDQLVKDIECEKEENLMIVMPIIIRTKEEFDHIFGRGE